MSDSAVDPKAIPVTVPALRAFERTRDPGPELNHFIKLDRNERAAPLPEWFVERLRGAVSSELFTNYPIVDELYDELAASLGLDPDRLTLAAGSDAAIKAVYHAFVAPGDGVVALDPSYAMYAVYADMFQARFTTVPIERSLLVDVDRLIEAISSDTRVVMLANPNQPTGRAISEGALEPVLARAAEVGALVAVDEAYYPCSDVTMIGRLDDYPHLVVIRTFSKAAGLAGLRIAYAAGHPEIVRALWKVRSANDINSMAIACAREVVRHPEIIDDCVADMREGARVLAQRASELGLDPEPTDTNFMLIRVADTCPPGELVKAMAERGYLIKGPFGAPCISDCIRITLGPPELMGDVADALAEAIRAL